ncbi:MAG: hypothetical protein B7X94_05855 [Hydrogenophilales bacterium 17-62-8]|nr:MAG: hypothetical protein B7X94_05855 [Hydrogenophilales bacterium 17-62-8]
MDSKVWLLAGLVWLLWVLTSSRKDQPDQPRKIKKFKLFRDKPADLKDAIYHPKEWRKQRK